MKHINILIILTALVFVAACGGKGVETGTPKPIQTINVQIQAADGSDYKLMIDEDGKGTIEALDENGNVLATAAIDIDPDENGDFETTVTFDDGSELTLKGHLDKDDVIIEQGIVIVEKPEPKVEENNLKETVKEIVMDGDDDDNDASVTIVEKPDAKVEEDNSVPEEIVMDGDSSDRVCIMGAAGLICWDGTR